MHNIEEQIKNISNISFKFNTSKDSKEKEKLDNELKDIIINLKKQAIDNFKSESDVKKFLDNIVKLHKYSFNNQMLIWLQNPNANYVASFKTFSDMGYKVNKGEKSIKILIPSFFRLVKVKMDKEEKIVPYSLLTEEEKKIYKDKSDNRITFLVDKLGSFRTGNVFDASQTNMPLEVIEEQLNPTLIHEDADALRNLVAKAIYKDNLKIEYVDRINNGAKGYFDIVENKIVVRNDLDNLMKVKVLIHEYAHALAHKHLIEQNKDYVEHRSKYETEAESISYVVTKYMGMDTSSYSNSYLYSWSKNKDFKEIDDSLSAIINYSKKIINNIEYIYDKDYGLYSKEIKI